MRLFPTFSGGTTKILFPSLIQLVLTGGLLFGGVSPAAEGANLAYSRKEDDFSIPIRDYVLKNRRRRHRGVDVGESEAFGRHRRSGSGRGGTSRVVGHPSTKRSQKLALAAQVVSAQLGRRDGNDSQVGQDVTANGTNSNGTGGGGGAVQLTADRVITGNLNRGKGITSSNNAGGNSSVYWRPPDERKLASDLQPTRQKFELGNSPDQKVAKLTTDADRKPISFAVNFTPNGTEGANIPGGYIKYPFRNCKGFPIFPREGGHRLKMILQDSTAFAPSLGKVKLAGWNATDMNDTDDTSRSTTTFPDVDDNVNTTAEAPLVDLYGLGAGIGLDAMVPSIRLTQTHPVAIDHYMMTPQSGQVNEVDEFYGEERLLELAEECNNMVICDSFVVFNPAGPAQDMQDSTKPPRYTHFIWRRMKARDPEHCHFDLRYNSYIKFPMQGPKGLETSLGPHWNGVYGYHFQAKVMEPPLRVYTEEKSGLANIALVDKSWVHLSEQIEQNTSFPIDLDGLVGVGGNAPRPQNFQRHIAKFSEAARRFVSQDLYTCSIMCEMRGPDCIGFLHVNVTYGWHRKSFQFRVEDPNRFLKQDEFGFEVAQGAAVQPAMMAGKVLGDGDGAEDNESAAKANMMQRTNMGGTGGHASGTPHNKMELPKKKPNFQNYEDEAVARAEIDGEFTAGGGNGAGRASEPAENDGLNIDAKAAAAEEQRLQENAKIEKQLFGDAMKESGSYQGLPTSLLRRSHSQSSRSKIKKKHRRNAMSSSTYDATSDSSTEELERMLETMREDEPVVPETSTTTTTTTKFGDPDPRFMIKDPDANPDNPPVGRHDRKTSWCMFYSKRAVDEDESFRPPSYQCQSGIEPFYNLEKGSARCISYFKHDLHAEHAEGMQDTPAEAEDNNAFNTADTPGQLVR
ncbi:unnamed protein product [Amoebophrya sp. A25]|nr:unnamed protein product [Amoebophrya sp. A25]|eukprot:GSA25T00006028001.1